jgi:hypothetical protein
MFIRFWAKIGKILESGLIIGGDDVANGVIKHVMLILHKYYDLQLLTDAKHTGQSV